MNRLTMQFGFSVLAGVAVVSAVFYRNIFSESSFPIHYTNQVQPEVYEGIKFEESHKVLGLNFTHKSQETRFAGGISQSPPTVAIVDLNGDHFLDVVISGGLRPFVFLNDHGKQFIAMPENSFGFDSRGSSPSGFTAFADLNNDGILDVVVAGRPDTRLFYGKQLKGGDLFFEQSQALDFFKANPEAINFLDYNQDGKLDIIFGSYTSLPTAKNPSQPLWIIPSYDNSSGGGQNLLLQTDTGEFKLADVGFHNRGYTHSLGISDFNRDNFPDVFVGNDYGFDNLYLNDHGKKLLEVTEPYIPRQYHGGAGMNGEIFDYNNSGHLSIYVTNIYKPPFEKNINLLWEQRPDGKFDSVSEEKGVARCGFAWGAKFADFNNDGENDLAVTNGRERAYTKKGPGESLWYRRSVVARMPNFLRQKYYSKQPIGKNYFISAFERDCLFIQHQGHFYDVAPFVGITELFEGRGLALIDFNNDGKMDYVVTNRRGPTFIYLNKSKSSGHWLGVQLRTGTGSELPIGAKMTLHTKSGKKMYREYYPANGYSAQSDPRLHFGLGEDLPEILLVEWPDHVQEKFPLEQTDLYVTISEGQSHGRSNGR